MPQVSTDDLADGEITKVGIVEDTDDQPFFQVGYSSFIDDPSLIAVSHRRDDAPMALRPTRLTRRRVIRPMGRAPRRPCNAHTRGSRRLTRAGPSSSDDDPHEDGESDGSFSRPLSLGVG